MVTSFHPFGGGSTSRSDLIGSSAERRGRGSEYKDTVRLIAFDRKNRNKSVPHILRLFYCPQGRAAMEKFGGAAGKEKTLP